MSKWTPGEVALALLGVTGVTVGSIVMFRWLVDAQVIRLPVWAPLPLLPSWVPGIPKAEEIHEPAEETGGPSMATITGYKAGKPIQVELVDIGGGQSLMKDAAAAFILMRDAAKREGVTLKVNTSFRDMAYQQVLYDRYLAGKGSLAAKPGFSNHQAGTALDLDTANGTNSAFGWLNNNASKYGFRRTVRSEPWHWEWFPGATAV